MPTLLETLEFVKHAHSETNGVDKTGTPYYWHLLRVMLRLQTDDLELQQIALLHDVVEDTKYTLDDLKDMGYSDRVIEAVKWSSRNLHDGTFAQWMKDIGQFAPTDTVLLKIADISDNLGFERMQGLQVRKPNTSMKPKKPLDLRQKIDKKIEKKMRLHGDMGVYDRYYKGWNFMFENESLLPLINQVHITDFCDLSLLQKLATYISPEEMKDYLSLNKIKTWSISGVLSITHDKVGQEYIAIKIAENYTNPYCNFLTKNIEAEYFLNQQNRDNNTHHITVINSMEYSKFKKYNPEIISQITPYLDKTYNLFTHGIGSAINKDNQAYFIVCENGELNQLRNNLSLKKQDFHVTLGFKEKDVFGIPKDRTSINYNNEKLWADFVEQNLPNKIKKMKM